METFVVTHEEIEKFEGAEKFTTWTTTPAGQINHSEI